MRLDGQAVTRVPPGIGFLFQSDALLPWKTARENVAIGAILAGKALDAARRRAEALLGDIGLGQALHKYPAELSGGMRKRVALARTMAYEPTVFLLDEPFSALDAQTRIHVGNRFLRVLETLGQTVLIVTHDIDEAIAMADRVLVMTASPGRIARRLRRSTCPGRGTTTGPASSRASATSRGASGRSCGARCRACSATTAAPEPMAPARRGAGRRPPREAGDAFEARRLARARRVPATARSSTARSPSSSRWCSGRCWR